MAERDITLRIAIEGEDAKRIIDDLENRGGGGRPGRGQTPIPGQGSGPQGGGGGGGRNIADLAIILGGLRNAITQLVTAADKVSSAANEFALQKMGISEGALQDIDASSRVRGMLQPFEFALGQLPPEQRKAEAARLAQRFHQDFAQPGAAGATAIRGATSTLILEQNPEVATILGSIWLARLAGRSMVNR